MNLSREAALALLHCLQIKSKSTNVTLKKLKSLFLVRLKVFLSYINKSPSWKLIWPWTLAGMVSTRILKIKKSKTIFVPLGDKPHQKVSLDLGSMQQRDAFHEVIIERNYDFRKIPFDPRLIIDCGANVGYFSCLSRVFYPQARLVAWEAGRKNFSTLKNQPILQDPKVCLYHAAVSNHDGEEPFYEAGMGGFLISQQTANCTTVVKLIDLRVWWIKNLTSCAVWKIDVEGHEKKLVPHLKGLWLAPCILFLETHEKKGNDKSLISCIKKEGFDLTLTKEHKLPDDSRNFREYFCIKA